jgi:protein-disulfide isomerase
MKNFRVEPCCGGTLEACAAQKPNCAIAARLASFTVWMDSLGTVPGDRMAEALQNRYETFADSRKFSSDLKGWPVVGDPNAPTTMVSYYSVTCPLCKSSFVELYTAVTSGPLKGRVKIVPKPFGAGTANIAAVAAHEMGRFAEFMIALGQENARIDENVIYKIADNMGLDRGKFKSLIEDPRLLKRAEQSVEEGRTNGVTHVPTYFIDGRRYESVINTRWIIEAIDFIQETAAKKK